VLPPALRPATNVFIPADLCTAQNGRLDITPAGVVTVDAAGGNFANAQCFTGFEGVSFARNATGYTAMTLINGWTVAPYGTAQPAAKLINGIVHLEGGLFNGTNPNLFTLPVAMRPAHNIFVPAVLCNAANGRLAIQTSGLVTVQAESSFGDAQCFTSLDGVTFAPKSAGATALTPLNGWTGGPQGTAQPAVRDLGGVLRFQGAVTTSGPNTILFTLPPQFRPVAGETDTKVDMCGATSGRMRVLSDGTVELQAENNISSNATCFTSLEGATVTM
jgi:hypothetical protein